jgi:para-nitrobenzyl esterase
MSIDVVSMTGVAQQPAPVKVAEGMVQGVAEDGLTVYKGIPFAAPPTGSFRWKAPQPSSKWDGVRQADKFAPGPMQGWKSSLRKKRRLLYLNVWTPAKSIE